MTKAELIEKVAKDTSFTQKSVQQVIETTFDEIVAAVCSGEQFKISRFGTFEIKKRAARKGKNLITGETIQIPAREVLVFHASKFALKKLK